MRCTIGPCCAFLALCRVFVPASPAQESDLAALQSRAEHGVEGGSDMLQRIAAEMTPEQIAAAQERARAWKPAIQPSSSPAIRAE